jgi:hypothetical protein
MWSTDGAGAGAGGTGGKYGLLTQMERCRSNNLSIELHLGTENKTSPKVFSLSKFTYIIE